LADETPILPAHIEDTIRAIAKLHADHHLEAGGLQRLSRLAPKSPAPETEAHLLEPPSEHLSYLWFPISDPSTADSLQERPAVMLTEAATPASALTPALSISGWAPDVCARLPSNARRFRGVTAAAFSASGTPRGMRRPDASRVEDEKQVTRHKHVMGESSWPG
jgi:hypothetical protein